MKATIYNLTDGSVFKVVDGDSVEAVEAQLEEGQAWLEGDFLHCRVDPETGEPMDLLEYDLTIAENIAAGVPAGTMVGVGNALPVPCSDGIVEIVTDWPETVPVTLYHPLYGERTIEVPCESTP